MWSPDRLKHLWIRALMDLFVLAAMGAAVVLVLWAYHGQQAYQVIQNTIAQQQAQQARQGVAGTSAPRPATGPPDVSPPAEK